MSAVVVSFQTFFRPLPVTIHASVRTSVHLVGPVTLPMMIWGTISLLLNVGQNLDPRMIMSEASRDARFRTSLGGDLCLPPTHTVHRLRRLHNSHRLAIALSEAEEANVLVRGLLSIQEIKLYLLNTMTAKHFVPSFIFSTLCTPEAVFLLCYYPHLDQAALYLLQHCLNVPIVEGTPVRLLNFPGHPGIWPWDYLPIRDTLSSEGERKAKITHIRFRVREPQDR